MIIKKYEKLNKDVMEFQTVGKFVMYVEYVEVMEELVVDMNQFKHLKS